MSEAWLIVVCVVLLLVVDIWAVVVGVRMRREASRMLDEALAHERAAGLTYQRALRHLRGDGQ